MIGKYAFESCKISYVFFTKCGYIVRNDLIEKVEFSTDRREVIVQNYEDPYQLLRCSSRIKNSDSKHKPHIKWYSSLQRE